MLLAVLSLICLSHLSLATLFACEGYNMGLKLCSVPKFANRGWSQGLQLSACNGCFSKFYASHFYIYFFIISNVFQLDLHNPQKFKCFCQLWTAGQIASSIFQPPQLQPHFLSLIPFLSSPFSPAHSPIVFYSNSTVRKTIHKSILY